MTRPAVRTSSRDTGLLGGLIEDVGAIVLVGLVVLGLGGIVYRLFRPEGWGSSLLGYLWDKSPWLLWLGAFSIATLTLAGRHVIGTRGSRSNLFAYVLLAAGLFFLFKLIVTGDL